MLVSHEYNEHTRQSMAAMSEKEMSFELIEVREFINKLLYLKLDDTYKHQFSIN